MRSDRIVALVMAAGYSHRFGPADKRLAKLRDGSTLLAASVASAQQAFPLVRAVLREKDDPLGLRLSTATSVLRVTRAEHGLGSSIGEAVTTLRHEAGLAHLEAVAILLGDMPDIRQETLDELTTICTKSTIIRPVYAGLPGHPVLFGRDFWPELEALNGDEGARWVIQQNRDHLVQIAIQDSGVCRDIDTLKDL